MKIQLQEWARRHYSPPPSMYTLRMWASTGQLPGIERVGTTYMLDEDTVRTPITIENIPTGVSSRVQRILKSA